VDETFCLTGQARCLRSQVLPVAKLCSYYGNLYSFSNVENFLPKVAESVIVVNKSIKIIGFSFQNTDSNDYVDLYKVADHGHQLVRVS
jgi:hypothetical protein